MNEQTNPTSAKSTEISPHIHFKCTGSMSVSDVDLNGLERNLASNRRPFTGFSADWTDEGRGSLSLLLLTSEIWCVRAGRESSRSRKFFRCTPSLRRNDKATTWSISSCRESRQRQFIFRFHICLLTDVILGSRSTLPDSSLRYSNPR